MALQFQQPNFNPLEMEQRRREELNKTMMTAGSLMMQYKKLKQDRELAMQNHEILVEEGKQRLRVLRGQYGTGDAAPTIQPQVNPSPTSPLNLNPMGTPGNINSVGSTLTAGPDMIAAPVPVEETIDELQNRIGSVGLVARSNFLNKYGTSLPGEKKGSGGDDKAFTQLQQLRTSYLNQSKDFSTIRGSYSRLKSTANKPSPAGDLSMLFNYMKLLDPGSVVRESEFANAAKAAPIMTRMGLDWDKLKGVWEGKKMTPDMRKDFVSQAGNIYKESVKNQKGLITEYKRVAEQSNLDPDLAVIDLFNGDYGEGQIGGMAPPNSTPQPGVGAPANNPVQIAGDDDFDKLPSGTLFVGPDGKVRVKP